MGKKYGNYRQNHVVSPRELSELSEYNILLGVPYSKDNKIKVKSLKTFKENGVKVRRHYNKKHLGSVLLVTMFQLMLEDIIHNNTKIIFPNKSQMLMEKMTPEQIDFKIANNLYSDWMSTLSNGNLFHVNFQYKNRSNRLIKRRVKIEYKKYHKEVLSRTNEGETFIINNKKNFEDYLIPIYKKFPYLEPIRTRIFLKNVVKNVALLVQRNFDVYLSFNIPILIYTYIPSKGKQYLASLKKEEQKKKLLANPSKSYRIPNSEIDSLHFYDKKVYDKSLIYHSKLEHHERNYKKIKDSPALKRNVQLIKDNNLINNYPFMENFLY